MKIVDLLKRESVELNGKVTSKPEAIEKMVALMAAGGNLADVEAYKKGVFAREEESTTGIGEGIAIPHAKTAAVKAPGLAAMVIKDGVDYDSLDGEPANLIFLIAAPDTEDNVHLEVLSRLSMLLMDPDFRTGLMEAENVDAFFKCIDEAERKRFPEEYETEENTSNETQVMHAEPEKSGYRVLAVTACPTGIAHTYMAAESLENKAKEMGITIKVETNDLGVHTEMYVDAFVDIAKAGKINGSRKQLDKGRQVYAFGAGTQKMYDYLNDNPECMSAPVDYTNDIRSISALDNFISINNAVDIDLFGQVNAESAGVKHISGAGGQLDFVLGAYLSKGGKSFICLSSTFFNKKTGQLESRIRPTLENGSIVTDTRANVHYLCTEYGCVNLKGLTSWEKAEALISVAHPDFREELIREAEKLHIWRRSNKI